MALSVEQLDTLVDRLETKAEEQPVAYKVRVFLLALLGYAYIFFVLTVLLLLVGLLLLAMKWGYGRYAIGKLAFVLLGLMLLMLRSLWVRVSPPAGLALTRQQAPRLFEAVDEIQRTLKAPKAHRILLTDDYNAAVAQTPRLGIFGWQQNDLIVGLPYMLALSPEQFRSVLAHEFGHLSGAHSRFSAWIYRVRATWFQLMEALERKEHWGAIMFVPFFRWYVPFFGAYSFVLARAQEYEADRAAAQLAGTRTTADALVNSSLKGAFLSKRFWPALFREAGRLAEPPAAYTEMQRALQTPIERERSTRLISEAISRTTGSADTHPSLADRLEALGQDVRVPTPVHETAAEYFLGSAFAPVAEHMNRAWQAEVAPGWRMRHAYLQDAARRLEELDARAERQPLALDEAWERAELSEELRGDEVALPLYRTVLSMDSAHAGANYAIGRILLSHGSAEGIKLIETAMQLSPDAILPGTSYIRDFLLGEGRLAEAKQYARRGEQHAALLEAAQAERARVEFSATYLYHDLPVTELASLREQLVRYPQIDRAYLVRKEVQHFPEHPLFVLGIVVRRPWLRYDTKQKDRQLVQRIVQDVAFSGETFAIVVNNDRNTKLKKIMEKIPGAEIYRRHT